MSFELLILRRAQNSLSKISAPHYDRIKQSILELMNEPRPSGCKKLSGRNGWRIRIGDFRVIYEIDDAKQSILILDVGNRREIYR